MLFCITKNNMKRLKAVLGFLLQLWKSLSWSRKRNSTVDYHTAFLNVVLLIIIQIVF